MHGPVLASGVYASVCERVAPRLGVVAAPPPVAMADFGQVVANPRAAKAALLELLKQPIEPKAPAAAANAPPEAAAGRQLMRAATAHHELREELLEQECRVLRTALRAERAAACPNGARAGWPARRACSV